LYRNENGIIDSIKKVEDFGKRFKDKSVTRERKVSRMDAGAGGSDSRNNVFKQKLEKDNRLVRENPRNDYCSI
jgi:hypothetical protein